MSTHINLKRITKRLPELDAITSPDAITPDGRWVEAEVPDTLDLADRAKLGINALIGSMKPDMHYAGTQCFRFGILGDYDDHPNWVMPAKFLRSLPLMRTMCGSTEYLDIECAAIRAILGQVAMDGLVYAPISADGPPKDTAYAFTSGLAVLAMLQSYVRKENPLWLDWARIIADGLKQSTINTQDHAYYPPEWSLDRNGKWYWTCRGPGNLATEPTEAAFDQEGHEGHVKNEQANVIRAMVRCYEVLGDAAALEHAGKLVRFCLQPKFWKDTHDPMEQAVQHFQKLVRVCVQVGVPWEREDVAAPGHEHGIWEGHVHGNMNTLQCLLAFAVVTGDSWLKQFCREGYEHLRRHGSIRLGFMPSWIRSPKFGRTVVYTEMNEGCGIADTLMLAGMLTDAGLGDYYDDIDSIVRNHFIELQFTDLELMKKVTHAPSEYDETFKRIIGGFADDYLTSAHQSMANACCTGNGTRALYFAWEPITRFRDGIATVNLFLNRASAWMDVDSYLPYEGKVVLRNKQAHTTMIRMPYWVDQARLKVFLNDRAIRSKAIGNFRHVDGLSPGDTIRVEFPVAETTEIYTICGTKYTAKFRGSTVVDISPRDRDTEAYKNHYPFFERDHMEAAVAPMRKVNRFVADRVVPAF